jgi:hypothetical protein
MSTVLGKYFLNMALSKKSQRELTSQYEVLVFERDSLYTQVDDLYNLGLSITLDSADLDLFKNKMERLESQYSSFNKINLEIIKIRTMLDGELKTEVSAR